MNKTGPFANKDRIWNSQDLVDNKTYMWHKKYSLDVIKYLGKLACRVTSKIMGIGSAERSWGDVKHIKTGKRSHLSPEVTKMQATLYGARCCAEANIRHENMLKATSGELTDAWGDMDDFYELGLTE